MSSVAQDLESALGSMRGRIHAAELGVGSFVTLALTTPGGEWSLWIRQAAWRVTNGARVSFGSTDPRDRIDRALPGLVGRLVQRVKVEEVTLTLKVELDGDLGLDVFPVSSRDAPAASVACPDGQTVTIGPGTRWTRK